MAPEVVLNNHKFGDKNGQGNEYGLSVDVWALGLFLFNFIEGKNPFNGGDLNRTYSRILKGEFDFTNDHIRWLSGKSALSYEAKDLILKLL
jgi:serine/threonine protein kinase